MALAAAAGTASAATAHAVARSATAVPASAASQAQPVSAQALSAPGGNRVAITPDSSWEGCNETYFCFWVNADYGGDMGEFQGDNAVWGDYADSECQTGTWADCASSAVNNGTSGDAVEMYQDNNYEGESFCVPDDSAVLDFAGLTYENGAPLNDSVNSNLWVLPQDCGYAGG
jgi:hypothetical protein